MSLPKLLRLGSIFSLLPCKNKVTHDQANDFTLIRPLSRGRAVIGKYVLDIHMDRDFLSVLMFPKSVPRESVMRMVLVCLG